MKKMFAALLAVTMLCGMSTVALADNTVVDLSLEGDFYEYDKATGRVGDVSIGYRTPGSCTYYIPVTTKVETDDGLQTKNTISTSHMKNYRLRLDTTKAGDLVNGIEWKVMTNSERRDAMFVAVDIGSNTTGAEKEITFIITVAPKDGTDAYVAGFPEAGEREYTLYVAPAATGTTTNTTTPNTTTPNTTTPNTTTPNTTTPNTTTPNTTTPNTTTPNTTTPNTQADNAVSSSASGNAAEVTRLIAQARKNGSGAPRVDLTTTNQSGMSARELTDLANAAKTAGGSVRILADSMTDKGGFLGRMYITPSTTAAITQDISYGVSSATADVSTTKATFEKYYSNTVAVVHLAQAGTFGFPVEVAVKLDLSAMDTQKLKFYSYDRATNRFAELDKPVYLFDQAGFLHFNTAQGGDIIITDTALTAK